MSLLGAGGGMNQEPHKRGDVSCRGMARFKSAGSFFPSRCWEKTPLLAQHEFFTQVAE